jgi:hypothetical protein
MGCSSSAECDHTNVNTNGWVALNITKKGDVVDISSNKVLAKAQQTDKGPLASVGGKGTAVWNDDAGALTYEQVESEKMDDFINAVFKKVGAQLFDPEDIDECDWIMGTATLKETTWDVIGAMNSQIYIVDSSGKIILHYVMGEFGQKKLFYNRAVTDEELEQAKENSKKEGAQPTAADNALIAQQDTKFKGSGILVLVKPEVAKEIPVALLAVCNLFGGLSLGMVKSMSSTNGFMEVNGAVAGS